jgi:hypothetical protein
MFKKSRDFALPQRKEGLRILFPLESHAYGQEEISDFVPSTVTVQDSSEMQTMVHPFAAGPADSGSLAY